MADNFDGIVLDRDGNINNDVEGGEVMNYKEIMVFFLEPEAQDILYMLEDAIESMDAGINMFGEPSDEGDRETLDLMKANLAVAIRLQDKLTKEFELSKETGQ